MSTGFTIEHISQLLPPPLVQILARDSHFYPLAVTAINRFSAWFQTSGLPFFRHYTDHSATHSFEVFGTAIDLIDSDAFDVVTAEDLSVILCASFCHDCGMHITESQFLQLISAEHKATYTTFDEVNWPTLWTNFLQQAKRYNQSRLLEIFGDTNPVPELPSTEVDFSDRHRLLVGEFLRKHHPRLAHDIAVGLDVRLGLPDLLQGFDRNFRDIIGLVARSHGHSLRLTLDYVSREYDRREFSRVHIVYLMGLLRLADYAQMQPTRAPRLHTAVHSIPSPISQREWRVHQSVRNITRTHDDPEAILVDCRPENIGDYLRAREWLVDLQAEFDGTWAVLGELYGRHDILQRLQLTVRRVRSSLLDGGYRPPFIPQRVRFSVAETEMLSLLLSPLYGNHSGYGVRELLQNARDAVLEAQSLGVPHLHGRRAEVAITLRETTEGATLTVLDNGVGMTSEILINYFLNAGASYRSSLAWQSAFKDDSNKVKIPRAGRFGVGALAAFLIGPALTVSTRHWTDTSGNGLHFTSGLHDPEIQITELPMQHGTKIQIDCSDTVYREIRAHILHSDNIYSFDDDIEINLSIVDSGGVQEFSALQDELDAPIKLFKTSKFPRVELNKHVDNYTHRSDFVNGIAIRPIHQDNNYYYRDGVYRSSANLFNSPSVTRYPLARDAGVFRSSKLFFKIEDRDGYANLNLARTSFNDSDEEVSSLVDSYLFHVFCDMNLSCDALIRKNAIYSENMLIGASAYGFFFRDQCIMPFDFDLAEEAGVTTIFNLAEVSAKSALDAFSRNPRKVFAVSDASPVTASAIAERFRRFRILLSPPSKYEYVIMFISQKAAKRLYNVASPSKWILDSLEGSEIIMKGKIPYHVIEFGSRVDTLFSEFIDFVSDYNGEYCELLHSSSSLFLYRYLRSNHAS